MAQVVRKDANFTSFTLQFSYKVTWSKVKQVWQVELVAKSGISLLISELVKILVHKSLCGIETLFGCIYHNLFQQIDQQGVGVRKQLNWNNNYVRKGLAFDIGELVVFQIILGVHLLYLAFGGSADNLNHFDQMVY